MQLFKRERTAESIRERIRELEELAARASTGRDEASADLAYAIAAGGAVVHEGIRRRLARASAAVSDAEAGLGVARASLVAAEEREAAERLDRARKEALASNHATVAAAKKFDAALVAAGEAYEALCTARALEHNARLPLGLPTRRRAYGHDEVCALFAASPRLATALRKRMISTPLPPTNKNFRPMVDFVANPSVDVETDAETPDVSSQEVIAHVQ